MVRAAHDHVQAKWFAVAPKTDEMRRVGQMLHMAVTNITTRLMSAVPDIRADEVLLRHVLAPVLTTILRYTSWGQSSTHKQTEHESPADYEHVDVLVEDILEYISDRVS